MQLVINYDTGDTTDPIEEHHIVPYLIGESRNKDDEDDDDASEGASGLEIQDGFDHPSGFGV